jgi:hypothetical protein
MILQQRHRRYAGILILTLFVLTSSGFTAVLHTCVMGGAQSCLCEREAHRAPQGGQVINDGLDCCQTYLAGGLNPVPTTVGESQFSGKPAAFVTCVLSAEAAPATTNFSSSFLLSSDPARGVPPCSTERYILTATFRI